MKKLNLTRSKDTIIKKNGQHWFLYWQIAPSLWRERLEKYQKDTTIFVPINWRFHHHQTGQVDFQGTAERDLGKLHKIGIELRLNLVFLFPISPMPIEEAGGVPNFLQNSVAKNKHNLSHTFLQADSQIYTQASFFNPALFEHYFIFVQEFHKWIRLKKELKICFVQYQIFQDDKVLSLFDDYSLHFEQGFSRYIKKQKILNQKSQDEWEDNYRKEIQNLYLETAKDLLGDSILGSLKFTMLGGGTQQFFMRTYSSDIKRSGYFYDALKSIEYDSLPCTILLNESEKMSGIDDFLEEIYSDNYLSKKMNNDFDLDESDFFPFSLIHAYGFGNTTWRNWNDSGLFEVLDQNFPWLLVKKTEDDLDVDDPSIDQLYFFGGDFSKEFFHKIINLFMSGTNSYIDTALMPEDLKKQLEVFILENSLNVEIVNFIIPIKKASLGESSIILFSSADLLAKNPKEQENFWERLLQTTHIAHLNTIESEGSIYSFWQRRAGSPYELSYQEVRRLFLFNPSHDKKTIRIGPHKNFALLKNSKTNTGRVSSTKAGVEIILEPRGSMTLDYGYFDQGSEL